MNNKGFTVFELLIVLMIIGIIIGVTCSSKPKTNCSSKPKTNSWFKESVKNEVEIKSIEAKKDNKKLVSATCINIGTRMKCKYIYEESE